MARVYATQQQLAAFPGGDTVPAGSETRALTLASQVVDRLLVGHRYDTDSDGLPTDTDVAQAMADATCAIAVEAVASGALEPGSTQQWESVAIGNVQLSTLQGRSASDSPTVYGIPVPAQALVALLSIANLSVTAYPR